MSTKVVLLTSDNKRVVICRDTDECLYKSPCNPPNTGTRYTDGTDFYLHRSRNDNSYFYGWSWSMWQGKEESYFLVTRDELEEILLEKLSGNYWVRPSDSQLKRLEELGFNLLEETA